MNVLHVIPSLSFVQGGPSVMIPVIERGLTRLGVNVETASTDDDGLRKHHSKPLGEPVGENGVTRWYFHKQTEFYKISRPLAKWLEREIHRFDVVHIHGVFSYTSTVAARAARRHQVPYIVRPLGHLNQYGMTQRRALLKRLSMRWIEGPLLHGAAAVHFTSQDEQSQAELLGLSLRSVVIPLGLERPESGNRDECWKRFPRWRNKFVILYLSRIDPIKNIEALLRATAQLGAEFPDVRLAIAGDGTPDYLNRVQTLATQLHLAERVDWLGHVSGAVKNDILAASQLFVLPSFSENFGVAVVEALFAGLPCIVTPGVAIGSEIPTAGAGEVVAPDAASLATALRRLLSSKQALLDAGANARRLAQEKFSSGVMAERLVQLYRDILRSTSEKVA